MTHPEDACQEESLSYRDSGVDIDLGNRLVENIKPLVRRTYRPGVLQGIGGFGALFELPLDRYRRPVLVSGTDGVGTKLKLATLLGCHDSIGIDLVAMCVNDILTCGAEPLYFMDYLATGKLDAGQAEQVIRGIAEGCIMAGCALAGGETAEMPGMYRPGDYDLAGFAVGVVEKSRIIEPQQVRPGNLIIGLESSGPHSNGYSLIRHLIDRSGTDLDQPLDGSTLAELLISPTRIYVEPVLNLLKRCRATAICHITGGGMIDNVPRVLPEGLCARISGSAWTVPPIFSWIQERGNIRHNEMLRTFNCGIGMIVCVASADLDAALDSLSGSGERPVVLGEIVESHHSRIEFTD